MRKLASAALCLAGSAALVVVVHAQARGGGAWATAGGDPQLTGWQKSEPRLTRDNAKEIKYLWKLKLGSGTVTQPTEPIFAGHTLTGAGFKDMALVMGPENTLSAVDYELGTVQWQHQLTSEAAKSGACPGGQFASLVLEPPATFGFAARGRGPENGRGAAGGRGAAEGRGTAEGGRGATLPMAVQPPPNPEAKAPRVGGNLAGPVAFGGMRGIFVLTSDGKLHEQVLTNGWDYGQPVSIVPAGANIGAPKLEGTTLYVTTSGDCGGAPNGVVSVDMSTPEYAKASYKSGDVGVTGTDGAALSTDNSTLFVTTGSGAATGDAHPNSVLALDAKTLEVKDYYTPSGGEATAKTDINVSPVVFSFKGREYVAAYVAGGRLALLDATSLGGADHHTPVAVTPALSKNGGYGAWGRLATAEDANGARFIYVSVNGPFPADLGLPKTNGATPSGAVVAYKLEDEGGKTKLTPAWVSPDVANPSPPSVVMNMAPETFGGFGGPPAAAASQPAVKPGGIVFVLAEGEAGISNARLYGFDAETGARVYSSMDEIKSPANQASLSISGGHVLLVTSDNNLYAFGVQYVRD